MASKHRVTVGEELRYDSDLQGLKNLNGTYVQGSQLPVNAKSAPYNAKGDNFTDDTTALQAAFTAAAGGVCFVPDGTYLGRADAQGCRDEDQGRGDHGRRLHHCSARRHHRHRPNELQAVRAG
jgi:hypothetical protein